MKFMQPASDRIQQLRLLTPNTHLISCFMEYPVGGNSKALWAQFRYIMPSKLIFWKVVEIFQLWSMKLHVCVKAKSLQQAEHRQH